MPGKLIIASEMRFGSGGAALAHGFRKCGWDVQEIDHRYFFPQSQYLPVKAIARLTGGLNARAYNAAILQTAEQIRPDAFLTVKGLDIASATLRKLKERGVKLVNFYPDLHFDHAGIRTGDFALFDLFITAKSFHVEFLRSRLPGTRVEFVHHGYSDEAQYPRIASVAESDYLHDVLYVGNHTLYKERWLTALAERLPQVRLLVIGDRWNTVASEKLRRCALGNVLYGDFYARAVQLSRINLAFHAGSQGLDGWQDLVSTRTFEIPACKGFMLHIDNAEVRELFTPDEIAVFDSEDTMIERIEFFMARPQLRAAMIERAYRRCCPAYGYDARAKDIVNLLRAG